MLLASGTKSATQYVDFTTPAWVWVAFGAFVTTLLIVDLLLVHRRAHVISTKEAAIESAAWISLGLSFALVILWWHGGAAAGEYLSGYLIEKSLSVDNVFVWALIMGFFTVPRQFQHRVLFWGIFGALLLRAAFIFGGVALLSRFEWVIYIFGAFLLYTAIRLVRHQEVEVEPEHNPVLRLMRRVIPSTTGYEGQHLFVRRGGKVLATALFSVLIVIETTDVVFAVDSIPAILAVSREQFIVFSSNAFAILGLRALYFLLADLHARFDYLQQGLAVVLAFVGMKMLASHVVHIPTPVSLAVIVVVLGAAIGLSVRKEAAAAKQLGTD